MCPSAMRCSRLCYARKGTYNFRNVKAKHVANLELVLDDLGAWADAMRDELGRIKQGHVRIHDGGDFFSEEYLRTWLALMEEFPHIVFYAYTKEVPMFRRVVEPAPPLNFHWIYSYGGRWDDLITDDDRRADVFPSIEALQEAGFTDQEDSDLLAIYGPKAVGIVVNNHPGAQRAMQEHSFGGR